MRHSKEKLPPFVPLYKATLRSPAWLALSHGARSLYTALKARYNKKLGNSVYLSTRTAVAELGSHSHRDNVQRWFRELQHYGFLVLVAPGHLGVEGRGKAPHWRLTEEWHLGEAPTRDYLRWDGAVFQQQKRVGRFLLDKQNPGPRARASVDHASSPPLDRTSGPVTSEGGPRVQAIQKHQPGPGVQSITSLTTTELVASDRSMHAASEYLRTGSLRLEEVANSDLAEATRAQPGPSVRWSSR